MSRERPLLDSLGVHPFVRVARLLDGLEPGAPPIDLTIGEPRTSPPAWLGDRVAADPAAWSRYPPNDGTARFRDAAGRWLERRYGLPSGTVGDRAVVPTAGAREALAQLAVVAADRGDRDGRPLALLPTPHYAPYRGGVLVAGLEPFYLPSREPTFLPDLDLVEKLAPRASVLFVCAPSNPEGAVADAGYWRHAVRIAREHDLLLVADECYSEIYRQDPPPGVLAACLESAPGDDPFRGVVTVSSLSKRSGAAGLRVGFVAGDAEVVAALVRLRAYVGGTTSVPGLEAAGALLEDESHVEATRAHYRAAFDAVDDVLGPVLGRVTPAAGMFLWLRAHDPEALARTAWSRAGVRVVPGRYLGPAGFDGHHPGADRVRLAVVHDASTVRTAMERLVDAVAEELCSSVEAGGRR